MFRSLFGGGVPRDPLDSTFGALEREVLGILWTQGGLAVRDVQSRLPRDAAYTTVMTTLDRLFKKGVLSRERSGRAFLYSPAVTRDELQARIAGRVLTGILQARDGASLPVLSNLVDTVSAQEGGEELLRRLEKMVREKRQRLEQGKPR